MFEFIKKLFGLKKEIGFSIREYEENRKRYCAMSKDEFVSLPEEELFDAALARADAIALEYDDILEGLDKLNHEQRMFYVANYYEAEVMNGGLCQFFVNSSRYVAPELSPALKEIGADEHRLAFDKFAKENGIDLNDLDSFDADTFEEYSAQTERYPFDRFDGEFYDREPIHDILERYIKANIEKF